MKIIVLDGYTLNPGDLSWEELKKSGDLTVYDRTPRDDEQEILNRIGDAEIVFTNKTPLTASIIEKAPAMAYIGVLATGYNVVDLEAAAKRKIPVTNIPAYGTSAVAQFTISLLLEICNQVGHHSLAVKEGRWETCTDFCFWDSPIMELAGKTMGIIGFGKIGQETGRLAQAFGMKVLAWDKYRKPELETESCHYADSLDQLYGMSDVISLHCPLFPETEGLINRETIAKMKDGVIILNAARGPLIREADLAEALNSGKVYAAGLDVVSTEPIQGDNPLLTAANCFITPHIAWASRESRQRLLQTAVENLRAYLNGQPVNVVNK